MHLAYIDNLLYNVSIQVIRLLYIHLHVSTSVGKHTIYPGHQGRWCALMAYHIQGP